MIHNLPSWQSVVDNTEILVAFGGMPLRNNQICSGGTGAHRAQAALTDAKSNGVTFVNISPIWMPTALAAMLGQIGQTGGGVAFGYCASLHGPAVASVSKPRSRMAKPLPSGCSGYMMRAEKKPKR